MVGGARRKQGSKGESCSVDYTREQVRRYFRKSLDEIGEETVIPSQEEVLVQCPECDDDDDIDHEEGTDSTSRNLRLFLDSGYWFCHKCQRAGDLKDFEERIVDSVSEDKWLDIEKKMGIPLPEPSPKPRKRKKKILEERPDAEPAPQKSLFEKRVRAYLAIPYEEEQYSIRSEHQRPLFRIVEVLRARFVFVMTKKADAKILAEHFDRPEKDPKRRKACTANSGFKGYWDRDHGKFFNGKQVFVLASENSSELTEAQAIAYSINGSSDAKVRLVHLPGMKSNDDVSLWLSDHGVSQLLRIVKSTPVWHPPEK